MTIHTTPLQFGYFFAWLFAILFWVRAYKQERYSDYLLGFVLFLLAMEVQDYTFGFAGINVLWERFNGFPRHFNLLFAPAIYFYIRSQLNRNFRITQKHIWHFVPYLIYVIIGLIIFAQGPVIVKAYIRSAWYFRYNWVLEIAKWASYCYYFYQCLALYKKYRPWAETQFSDTEIVSFTWVRNFIYLLIAGELFRIGCDLVDVWMGDLPYEQDFWWHLLSVCIIIYVGIIGYTQVQPRYMLFGEAINDAATTKTIEEDTAPINQEISPYKSKIEHLFTNEQIYLDPELNLGQLAQRLGTNSSVLSAVINQNFNKNFNELVNGYRVEAFEKAKLLPQNKHLTLLAIAMDCGFNSKATFNRAVKKLTGQSPKELMAV
jgi:AraC-like DNA-binding protein